MKSLLKSRKFWLAIVSAAVVVLNHAFGWDLEPMEVFAVIAPFLVNILGIAIEDGGAKAGGNSDEAIK